MKNKQPRQFQPVWKVAALAAVTGFVINFCSKFYMSSTWWALPTAICAIAWIVLTIFVISFKNKNNISGAQGFLIILRTKVVPFFARNLVTGLCLITLAIQAFNFIPARSPVIGDFFLMDKYKVRDQQGEAYYFVFDGFKKNQEQIVPEATYRQYERGDVLPVSLQPGLFGGHFVKFVGESPTPEVPAKETSTPEAQVK